MMYDDSCMRKVQQQFVIVLTATIVIWISTVTTVISQATDAQQDQENQSSSDNCASDQIPASINGTIQCMQEGQCYSEQFEGKEAKHCNFMMSNQ